MRRSIVATNCAFSLLVAGAIGGPAFAASPHSKPVQVGMVALLAAPQKYDGKVVWTRGFLFLRQPEDNSLWLHQEDLQNLLWKNSFALDLTQKQREEFKSLNHTYVVVHGTLHSKGPDGSGLQSGTITDITVIHGWSPYVPFEPKKR